MGIWENLTLKVMAGEIKEAGFANIYGEFKGFHGEAFDQATDDRFLQVKNWEEPQPWPVAPLEIYVASTDDTDTAEVVMEFLCGDWVRHWTLAKLQGQTPVRVPWEAVAPTDALGIMRVQKVWTGGAVNIKGEVSFSESDQFTDGVPDDATTIHEVIHPYDQVSQSTCFSVPDKFIGVITRAWASIVHSHEGTQDNQTHAGAKVVVRFRPYGGVFQSSRKSGLSTSGTSVVEIDLASGPAIVPPRTDVVFEVVDAHGGVIDIAAGYDILFIPIDYLKTPLPAGDPLYLMLKAAGF